jgi:hypothetical protein
VILDQERLKVDSRRQACCRARGTSYAKEHSKNEMVSKLLSKTGKPKGIKK